MQGEPDPSADAAGTSESAEALARAIVDGTAIVPSGLPDAARKRLAWKLKEQCYAAWNTAPQRAAAAATAVAALFAQDGGNTTPAAQEIGALAAWTAAIAAITRGDMAVAVELLDAAAEAFVALSARKHAAETQVPKIVALTMQGQHAAAAACGDATLREFVALGDTAAAAKVGLNLGSLHLRRDNFREAAARYREASLLFARAGDREHSVMADIGLADALASQGDADEALRIYARAAMRAGAHGFAVLEAIVEESVALLQLSRGDYREALAGLESARRRYEALAMPQYHAIAEKQLADVYLELHLLPEARALFADALGKFEALGMPDDAAWTLVQLGRAHALLDAPEEADAALVRAGTAFVAQDNDVGAAAVALSRAELALARGDPQQAAMLAQPARDGFIAANLPDRAARASIALGHAHLARGDGRGAADVFARTLDEARALRLLAVQVRCLTGQGLAARALGSDDAARAAFEAAVELFEEMRATLPGDEIRSAFLGDHLRPFQELLRCALDAQAVSPSTDSASAVLWQLDRLKARALGERLTGGGDDATNEAPIQSAAIDALRARLSWLYRRVRKLEDEGAPSVSLATELRATEQRLLEESRRLRVAAPRLAQSANAAFELDVGALRERLGPADALVEYGVQGDELFACIVTHGAVVARRSLAPWRLAHEAIRSLRFQIETLAHGAAPVAQHLPTLAARADARMRALSKLVWAPLADAIGDCRRLLIVPHMELAAVPFAALARSMSSDAPADDSRMFAVVPSARIAATILARETTSPRRALVVGESARLPHAADEAEAVAHRFAHADAFVGDRATLAAFHAHAADADVIHLACHAQFRADNPRFSALHLVDGPLTVETIEGLSLKPATVVLSACETGMAEAGAVAEMIGLVRAFLLAGAIRVVASLWRVDDATTAAFMQHFHAALAAGAAPASALQDAQHALRATHPHPYFWAAFVLYGRW